MAGGKRQFPFCSFILVVQCHNYFVKNVKMLNVKINTSTLFKLLLNALIRIFKPIRVYKYLLTKRIGKNKNDLRPIVPEDEIYFIAFNGECI